MDPVQQTAPVAPQTHLKTSGFAIAGLVLGIISLMPYPISGFPCAILALVFGLVAKGKIKKGLAEGKGMSTAGIILGSIGLVISIVATVFIVLLFMSFASNPTMVQDIQAAQQRALIQGLQNSQQGSSAEVPSTVK